MNNIIQVAGVIDQREAELLISCGVEYLGFPLRLPVNTVDHSEQEAREIISNLPSHVKAVAITYQNNAQDIVNFLYYLRTNYIQLHGDIAIEQLKLLKQYKPEVIVFKSLVIGTKSIEQLKNYISQSSPYIDMFITDTYDPNTGASGATGIAHDWSISKELVEYSPKPVILAGGLNPDNIYDAIITVKPAGVDVHTGVEDKNGRKDSDKVLNFLSEAQRAFMVKSQE